MFRCITIHGIGPRNAICNYSSLNPLEGSKIAINSSSCFTTICINWWAQLPKIELKLWSSLMYEYVIILNAFCCICIALHLGQTGIWMVSQILLWEKQKRHFIVVIIVIWILWYIWLKIWLHGLSKIFNFYTYQDWMPYIDQS